MFKSQLTGRSYNTNATLTAFNTFGKITNTTKVAYIYEDQTSEYLSSSAGSFIVRSVPEFSGTNPSSVRASSVHETIRNQNFFAVTTFDINDRYILDGLIRRDGSSLFGPEERWQTYYGLSGAWRVNEDLKIKGIDEFRLRASYGTAGLRPTFEAQYETLTPTGGSFTKAILGNPVLKPARSAELEVGGNLEFGNGRFTVEYTYAKKTTEDQILLVDVPSVTGFKSQWANTGTLITAVGRTLTKCFRSRAPRSRGRRARRRVAHQATRTTPRCPMPRSGVRRLTRCPSEPPRTLRRTWPTPA